jgi:dipeptidyl aminopeptidase/acylaminoacyl peptidase
MKMCSVPAATKLLSLLALLLSCHLAWAAPRPKPDAAPAPELVGEGVISTSQDEFGAMPDKDWTVIYFDRSIPAHYHYVMYLSRFQNGKWTTPEVLPFSGEYRDSDPVISEDGKTLYFVSDRPAQGLEANRFHAWAVERTATGWKNLRALPGPVNEKGNTEFISFAANGNLYFTSDRNSTSFDVYYSKLVNGKYQPAESLGPAINDGRYTIEAFVAPDERYILLGSFAQDSLGNADLYVSYNSNGVWSKPVNLGPTINTRARDYSPRISPDGKYMIFSSEKGFPTDKRDQPMTYDDFLEKTRGTLNGLGNIYRIPLDYVLQAARPPQ